jgi:hypothetical protein
LPEHLRGRIPKSIVELSEQTCLSIGYHFDDIMRHNVYFKQLTPKMKFKQIHNVIYDSIDQNSTSVKSASSQRSISSSRNSQLPCFAQDISSSEV